MYNEKLTKVRLFSEYNLVNLEERINDFCVKELPAQKDYDETECVVRDIRIIPNGCNYIAMIVYGDRD